MKRTAFALFFVMGSQIGASLLAAAQTRPTDECLKDEPNVQTWLTHGLSCGFDRRTMSYAGSAVEQARCLLRRVPMGGDPDVQSLERLPGSLEDLIGARVQITREQVVSYLRREGIDANDLGGPVGSPTSTTANGMRARYFVIHDTSTPNYRNEPFPANINEPSWAHNTLSGWQRGERSKAHVFIARTGASATARDYGTPWRAVRTETCLLLVPSRGLFLHNELVQPRRSRPEGRAGNDSLSPEPGFTPAQLDRLALLYVVASVRTGQWLIPAFHATVDEDLPGGHDDPQGFDLDDWARRVDRIRAEIRGL